MTGETKVPDGVSDSTQLLERIEALRDKWADQAEAIERIYGSEEPASCALRLCIGDLYDCVHADAF